MSTEQLPLGGARPMPTGWRVYKLDDIKAPENYSCVAGPFGSSISSKYFVETGVPVIRGQNLTDDLTRFVSDNFVFVAEERARQAYQPQLVREGDLVFTCWGTIGQVGIIPANGPYPEYVISNKQLKLRVNPALADPLFVYYYLASPEGVAHIRSRATGAAVPGINLGILKSLRVCLPPLDTQRRIAGILSAYDDLIENNRRRMALLEEAMHLLYRHWFVHLRFPGHEHTPIHDGVPEGWSKMPLGDALTLQRGFDLPAGERQPGEVPVYASTGIVGTHNIAKASGPGVVTGRSGSLGAVTYVHRDYWPLNTTLWVKAFKRVTVEYGYFLLYHFDLTRYQGGAAVPTLNRNAVHAAIVLVPPESLQHEFGDIVLPMLKQADTLDTQNGVLRAARDLLLPRLMNGSIPL